MSNHHRESVDWVVALGEALAEALPRLYGQPHEPLVGELIGVLTAALERGELEVALSGAAPRGVSGEHWPEGHRQALQKSPLSQDPEGPLVIERDHVLWRRWQRQRQRVLAELIRRAGAMPASPEAPSVLDASTPLDPLQRRAVIAAVEQGLVLLQGGPGTGKTSTVTHMIAALRRLDPGARIHLAAPTGKAAARLRAATGGLLPCTTLHRLLEARGERFNRNSHHPLGLDLLVIDEMSMVDLAMMEAVLEALPQECRLVLVGDPDQLPPIAPGPMLLELQCPAVRKALGRAAITLGTTYRNAGAIAAVAASLVEVNDPFGPGEGEGEASADPLPALRSRLGQLGPEDNLRWIQAPPQRLPAIVLQRLADHRQRLAHLAGRCREGDLLASKELLAERDRLLVLSPARPGRWGLTALHQALLGEEATAGLTAWPSGTPVICCRNLPELGLANGDVGVLVGAPESPRSRRVLFGEGQEPVWVHPAQLTGALEPALALTVHKAQGSEAEEVIVLLPASDHADRRLLYTALTRARRQAVLITPAQEVPSHGSMAH